MVLLVILQLCNVCMPIFFLPRAGQARIGMYLCKIRTVSLYARMCTHARLMNKILLSSRSHPVSYSFPVMLFL